jgi:aminoglycoside phosphotransferase (APT) family kinase protein
MQRRLGQVVSRALGLPPDQAPTLLPPPSGPKERTFLIKINGEVKAVLHALHSQKSLERLREGRRQALDRGVRVARLLWSDDSRYRRLLRGAYLIIEEYLDGTPLLAVQDGDPAFDRLATVLARLHSAERDRWGEPTAGKSRGFGYYRLKDVRYTLGRLTRTRALPAAEIARIGRTFASWRDRLDHLTSFQLIHDDLHRGNLLLTQDGGLGLVDLRLLRYERRERDLARVTMEFLDLDPEAMVRFEQHYLAAGGTRGEPDLMQFERAALCLRKWSSIAAQARSTGSEERRSDLARRSAIWEGRLQEHLSPYPGQAPR